jgi:hypothetical protein
MYEHRSKPLLPRRQFFARLARSAWMGLLIIIGALGLGMVGYHFLEKMSWLDAFANASMILSGMGPLGELKTSAGKLFAGCYALFSGVAFLTSVGVLFAPVVHRFLHKFHVEHAAKAESKKGE